jgi:hypothetical protein
MKTMVLPIVVILLILALPGLMLYTQPTFIKRESNAVTERCSTQQETKQPGILDQNELPRESRETNISADTNATDPDETASPNELSSDESSLLDANPTDVETHPSDARTCPPDGRIYLGSDEPFGYIPTNYPKDWENIPLTPPATEETDSLTQR